MSSAGPQDESAAEERARQLAIRLSPRQVVRVLGAVTALLVLAHVVGGIAKHGFGHGRLLGLVPLFDLDVENNVPTYFSALLLLSCALLFGVIATARRRLAPSDAGHWASLSALFVFLSFDEATMFHDRISRWLRDALDTSGVLFDAWVLPYGVLLVVLAAFYARFLRSLPARTRNGFLLAGGIYVAGAFGLEMVAGYYWTSGHAISWVHHTIQTFEETMEMAGLLVLIHALLSYIAVELRGLQVWVAPD
jgi:hypothetical protein